MCLSPPVRPALALLTTASLALAGPAAAQKSPADPAAPVPLVGLHSVPGLHVTHARLGEALDHLVRTSPSAARVVDDLRRSGLSVALGTPADLVTLPDSAGGPAPRERYSLMAGHLPGEDLRTPVAWVVLRVGAESRLVERVWIVVQTDSIELWIRRSGVPDAEARIEQDLLVVLAHEFVAHVGSIARSRRFRDFCSDPSLAQQVRTERAREAGEPPPRNGEAAACSLRVENRIRRELNRALALRGARSLPVRRNYSLDAMNFTRVSVRAP